MANYATLKSAIQQVIKENGNNEITGAILQSTLLSMINSLGAMYQFVGIADPSIDPGTPDYNVFYITTTPGAYPNFGGLVVPNNSIAVLKYAGVWQLQTAQIPSNQEIEYIVFRNIGAFYRVGYMTGTGTWADANDVHSIDKLFVVGGDVIELTGINDTTGMSFLVRGKKQDGTIFDYGYQNPRVESLGGGVYRINLPSDVSDIDFITISWLASNSNVTVTRIDNQNQYVKTNEQVLTPDNATFVKNNLALQKTDFIIDNDLVRKNVESIVVGKYVNTSGGISTDATVSYIKIPLSAGTKRIFFAVFDTTFSNVGQFYAFFDSSDNFLGGPINNQAVPNKVGITNAPVRNGSAYVLVDFEAVAGLNKFRVFEVAEFYNDDFFNDYFKAIKITNAELINSAFWDSLTWAISRTGDPIAGDDLRATKFIPCQEGEKFRVSNWLVNYTPSAFTYNVVFFDATLAAIGYDYGNATTYEMAIPANAKYVSFLYETGASISVKKVVGTGDVKVLSENLPASGGGNANWDGKTWVGLGDSLTAQSPSYVGLSWSPAVVAKTGLIFQNCGIGSTCLAGNGANAFWKRLAAVENYDPDLVTILGGANDLFNDIPLGTEAEFDKAIADKDCSTFMGAYSYIIETLLNWKKTLRIVIMTTAYAHTDGAEHTPGIGLTYGDYAEACRTVAHYYGLPIVDLYYNMGMNKITQTIMSVGDRIHWNAIGSQIVASLVIAKLNEINNA